MRISLQGRDVLGEERLIRLSEEKGLKFFSQWDFTEFSLHRNTGHIGKAHQSLSGSNDKGIDNIQRTIRAYCESGSDRQSDAKGPSFLKTTLSLKNDFLKISKFPANLSSI